MSILAALNRAYDHLAERKEVPPFGYSNEKIGYLIPLNEDGTVACPPIDLRDGEGKKKTGRILAVPQPAKRTSGIAPNFLWDKTSYVLSVTAGNGRRTAEEHAAFVGRHRKELGELDDPGMKALLAFLQGWNPESFEALGWPEEMKDQNVAFALEHERLDGIYLHDRPAARAIWARLSSEGEHNEAVCLVTGEKAPVARLHPAIKGVWGGQSSGVSIVSFNKEAFESYGHSQGDNAPVSEAAAFAYTAALNQFLANGSPNRIQIGDASTVFWAEAPESDKTLATVAENVFLALCDTIDESRQAGEVGAILDKMRRGMPVRDFNPRLADKVRFFVLGLAPNAARLSIRFWFEDTFGVLAEHYRQYLNETRVEPPPQPGYPPLWRYLLETAVLGKRENVPRNLAGEVMQSILTGTRYPQTLFSNVLMRMRSDKTVNALRVALLKALLVRNFGYKEAPVALDPDNTSKGYLLGRLFALYERIQTEALGHNVNSTIKDKFYGAASAQPRKVFHLLDSGSVNHLSKIGKKNRKLKGFWENKISGIMELMSPADDPFPASLSAEQQALFSLGYYHQRNDAFRSRGQDDSAPQSVQKEPAL